MCVFFIQRRLHTFEQPRAKASFGINHANFLVAQRSPTCVDLFACFIEIGFGEVDPPSAATARRASCAPVKSHQQRESCLLSAMGIFHHGGWSAHEK